MSTNCIVKKFKCVVDNDNLPKLGRIRFKAIKNFPAGSIRLHLGFTENTVVNFVNCTYNGQSSDTCGTALKAYENGLVLGENAYIEIDKYKLNAIQIGGFEGSLEYFKYVEHFNLFNVDGCPGDVTNIVSIVGTTNEQYPQQFACYGNDVYGDVSGLGLGGFLNIATFSSNNTILYGSLLNLALTSRTLTRVDLPNTKNVVLDIIGFVKRARKIGETTHSTIINFVGTSRVNTFVGDVIIDTSRAEITWTPTTITYNGTTIDNSEVEP